MFDLFVKHRQHIPESLRKLVRQARLFLFDMLPTESPADGVNEESTGSFVLPFPVVAVQDKVSCVIVKDLKEKAIGTNETRFMMEIANTWRYGLEGAYKLQAVDRQLGITEEKDTAFKKWFKHTFTEQTAPILLRWGTISVNCSDGKWVDAGGELQGCVMITQEDMRIANLLDGKLQDAAKVDFVRGCITAYEELLLLSRPQTFILESAPKKATEGKYLRQHERPTYTSLYPHALRKKACIMPYIQREKRTVEERRAHMRCGYTKTLSAERWKESRGKVIEVAPTYVKAIWNGATEGEDKTHKYRVILDLPKAYREESHENA